MSKPGSEVSERVKVSEKPYSGVARLLLTGAAIAFASLACSTAVRAQLADPTQNIGVRPELLKQVGIDQKLNDQIPLDLTFRDEHGKPVQLRQFFGQKPVILSLVYFTCPMLCTQVLNGLTGSLKLQSLDVGKDFNVLTISIDPTDKPIVAEARQEMYTGMYGRAGGAQGWRFLTGDDPQIHQLANAVGFRYAFDSDSKQYAHASAIMVLTPEGKISRYLYGIQYPSRDLRLALVEASEGKIGSPVDAILLFCYHYDPHTGKYGLLISRVIQASGGLTVLVLGILVVTLFRRERHALPMRRRA
jgi:protein SCO1